VILCVSQCIGIELLYPRNVAVADHGGKVHPPIPLGGLLDVWGRWRIWKK
ncbi:hypothetical protein A2U01_0114234, partial [Trifolium medium]|nr:hypothetical protein [Trifolium medium]